ncbi:MAG: phosphonate C-P lyase system protein PhnL [Alphaproteobacteria bacterium]|nr:phosphonate C-P lyase system protein PhnL [Alphaproteobacteria bacterium]
MIRLEGVAKTFVMHLRGGARLPIVANVNFTVAAGTCVVLGGPSGIGKSSVLKMIYGNYRTDAGRILVSHRGEWRDVAAAPPRLVLEMRRETIGYVSQFLRTIPRVGALDIVTAAAHDGNVSEAEARGIASELLTRLNVPERLWSLPPATVSGGEQQRINIATGFAARRPVLLLDEPTASLDDANRAVVVELIAERKRRGVAILGIFHDAAVREQVADHIVDVTQFQPETAQHA